MIQKFRKNPLVIEAIKLTKESFDEIVQWIGEDNLDDGTSIDEQYIGINTLEGTLYPDFGDYIIKGINGEFYPCKPDIFEKSYTLVGEDK